MVPSTTSIVPHPYWTDPVIYQVNSILNSYLAAGLIEYSAFQWLSLLVVATQHDDSIRVTVEDKRLNAVGVVGTRFLPRSDETLDSLGKDKVFSTFSLMSGF